MVKGIDRFREFFKDFEKNYVIIGGTACDQHLDALGLRSRSTKDIDAILIIEALTDDFVKRFWDFVRAGKYKLWQTASGETQFYRFIKPENGDFPNQIELFARTPDMITLPEGAHLTPIPVGEELSSFSAILLDDSYYQYAIAHVIIINELNFVNRDALIFLKAKAFLNNSKRREIGEDVRNDEIYKHLNDIYRISVTFKASDKFYAPDALKADLMEFINRIHKETLDTRGISQNLRVEEISKDDFIEILMQAFQLRIF